MPLIYNNTFYIGPGLTNGVFGHNTSSSVNKYARFYNNVIIKEGAGTVYLSYGHDGSGTAGYIANPAGFKNNILWGYDTDPTVENRAKISNGSQGLDVLVGVNGNTFQNPKLKIQTTASVEALKVQRGTKFPESKYADPEALKEFTGKERLRSRASLFAPADSTSPVIESGMIIPAKGTAGGTDAAVDGAWNAYGLTEDIFGQPVDAAKPPVGAAAKAYTDSYTPSL
jgi:hypothetical protein